MSATVFKKVRANNVIVGSSNNEITTSTGILTLNSASSNDVRVTYDLPLADRSVATKIYVDSVAAGLSAKDAVKAKAANLTAIVTYSGSGVGKTITRSSNGAIGDDAATYFDSVTLVVNDRVLVASETAGQHNGIYYVSNAGSAGTPWVLTRATDADNGGIIGAEVKTGMFTFVSAGTTYQGSGWVLITQGTITVDTTVLTFTQFSEAGSMSYANVGGGAGIWKDVNGSQVRFRSILATKTAGDTGLITATQNTDDVTINFDQSKITGTGTLTSGGINYTTPSSIISTGPVTLSGYDLLGSNKLSITSVSLSNALYDGAGTKYTGSHTIDLNMSGSNFFKIAHSSNEIIKYQANVGTLQLLNDITTISAAVFKTVTNSTSSFTFSDGSNAQLTIDTTSGAQKIIISNNNLGFASDGTIRLATSSTTALRIRNSGDSLNLFEVNSSSNTIVLPQGRLSFSNASTGVNKILVTANLASALSINDGSADYLKIVTTTSGGAVETTSSTSFNIGGGFSEYHPAASITANTTLTKFDNIAPVDATGAARTITLPSASANLGRVYIISKVDSSANDVIIAVQTGDYVMDVINDTVTLKSQFDTAKLVAITDGTKNSWVFTG